MILEIYSYNTEFFGVRHRKHSLPKEQILNNI